MRVSHSTFRLRMPRSVPNTAEGPERPRAAGSTLRRLFVGAVLALLTVTTVTPNAADLVDRANLDAFLRAQLALTSSELTALHQGRPIGKSLSATTKREMVTTGGIHIRAATLARFVNQFKTLEGFRTSQFVRQIAKFSEPPQLRDLDPLTLDADDIDALRKCRVGACDVQLSAEDIRRFNTEVDWRSSSAANQATELFKAVMFAQLNEYRDGGLKQLAAYNDKGTPVRLATETGALLDVRPSLLDHSPSFQDYVRHYPSRPLPNTENFFYWSKEAFGFKPVIGLNHVSIYAPDGKQDVIIATTQFYASHYMDASIAINALIPDPSGDGSNFYWLYLNRSRVGRLGGLLGTLSRPIVQRRVRAGLTKSLAQTKERLEAGR